MDAGNLCHRSRDRQGAEDRHRSGDAICISGYTNLSLVSALRSLTVTVPMALASFTC